ncbi:lipoyl(octanoyl) transferase LipB [Candidatus Binatia bacterium]|nr:lipoyl(octanoyl) transferase LipB [Candidatus Binatia bacterium]
MSFTVRDLGRCSYADALALQCQLLECKLGGDDTDYLLVVEHESVYTLGRGADVADLCGADARLGVPVFRVGRGGGVTYHGPGQVVAYPIVALRGRIRDVGRYVRTLEGALMATCAAFGIGAERRRGAPGAWVGDEKIAAVGVGVRRWVAWHGVALNVATDLSFFDAIVPCRMPSVRMTSMQRLLGTAPPLSAVQATLVQYLRAALEEAPRMGMESRP